MIERAYLEISESCRVSAGFYKITDDGMEYRLEDAIGKPTGEDNGEVNCGDGEDKNQTDRALAICIRKVRFEDMVKLMVELKKCRI